MSSGPTIHPDRGRSTPTGPDSPLRSSESAKVGDPPSRRSKRRRRRTKRGTSCPWQCGQGGR
eukprot:13805232-Alexandrium_andersonii.AAC.1